MSGNGAEREEAAQVLYAEDDDYEVVLTASEPRYNPNINTGVWMYDFDVELYYKGQLFREDRIPDIAVSDILNENVVDRLKRAEQALANILGAYAKRAVEEAS